MHADAQSRYGRLWDGPACGRCNIRSTLFNGKLQIWEWWAVPGISVDCRGMGLCFCGAVPGFELDCFAGHTAVSQLVQLEGIGIVV